MYLVVIFLNTIIRSSEVIQRSLTPCFPLNIILPALPYSTTPRTFSSSCPSFPNYHTYFLLAGNELISPAGAERRPETEQEVQTLLGS